MIMCVDEKEVCVCVKCLFGQVMENVSERRKKKKREVENECERFFVGTRDKCGEENLTGTRTVSTAGRRRRLVVDEDECC